MQITRRKDKKTGTFMVSVPEHAIEEIERLVTELEALTNEKASPIVVSAIRDYHRKLVRRKRAQHSDLQTEPD